MLSTSLLPRYWRKCSQASALEMEDAELSFLELFGGKGQVLGCSGEEEKDDCDWQLEGKSTDVLGRSTLLKGG